MDLKPVPAGGCDDLALIDRVVRPYPHLKFLAGFFSSRVYTPDAAQVLVMRVQRWERKNDLDPEADLTAACRRLVSPEISARIRTEGEFLAEFSAAVAVVLAERRRREENAHHKRPDPESFSGFTEAQRVALGIATGLADSIGTRVGGNKRGQVQAEIEAQNKGKAEGQEARG
jgi:hypothetical protein